MTVYVSQQISFWTFSTFWMVTSYGSLALPCKTLTVLFHFRFHMPRFTSDTIAQSSFLLTGIILSNLSSIGISRFFISWRSALHNGMVKTLTKTAEISKNVTKNAKFQSANFQPRPLGKSLPAPITAIYSWLGHSQTYHMSEMYHGVQECPSVKKICEVLHLMATPEMFVYTDQHASHLQLVLGNVVSACKLYGSRPFEWCSLYVSRLLLSASRRDGEWFRFRIILL